MRRHLTFSNVIACLALFIALGGISWAAATAPKNSVASKSIKKNAVTASKIRSNSISTRKIRTGGVLSSDVKNDALTGVDINESTLGTVPSAGTAADQINVVQRVNASAANSDPNIARAQAAEVPLAGHGAVSVYAKCFVDSDTGTVYYSVYGRTNTNGATMIGNDVSDPLWGGPALNANTLEVDREASADARAPTATDYTMTGTVSLLGPDGIGLNFEVFSYVRAGDPADAPGFLNSSASCAFHLAGSKVG